MIWKYNFTYVGASLDSSLEQIGSTAAEDDDEYRELRPVEVSAQTRMFNPNGVYYTENLSKGSWILKTPNAMDVMSQLMGVDDAEKVSWSPCCWNEHL